MEVDNKTKWTKAKIEESLAEVNNYKLKYFYSMEEAHNFVKENDIKHYTYDEITETEHGLFPVIKVYYQ